MSDEVTNSSSSSASEAPAREPVATHFDSHVADQASVVMEDLVGGDEGQTVTGTQGAPQGSATAGDVPDSPAPQEEPVEQQPEQVEDGTESAVPATLDDYTLLRAERAGLDKETAAQLQAAGRLDKILQAHDGHLIDQMLQRMQPQQPGQEPVQGAQQQQQVQQPPQPAQAPAAAPELTFKPEDWQDEDGTPVADPIRKNVERIAQASGAFQNQVREAVGQLMQQYIQPMMQDLQVMKAEYQAGVARQFDDLVAKQGDAWQPILGVGPTNRLAKDSKEAKVRQELAQHIGALDAIERAQGTARPGDPSYLPELFQRALGAKHSDKLKQIATAEVQAQVQDRRSQIMHPPTRRASAIDADPRGEAKAAIRKQKEAMGLPVSNRITAAQRAEDEANLMPG